jgi:tetratricopeptide (TPR) repeat protein
LAGTLAFATVSVEEAWAAGPAASDKAKLKEAEKLYRAGETKFETADYEEALALWKEAYGLLPDTPEAQVIRHTLVYNISEAQIKAYEINRNVTHLRKGKLLLEDYLAQHRQLYGDDNEAASERSEARDRLRLVEKKIQEAESRGEKATPITGPSGDDGATPEGETPAEGEGEQAEEPKKEERKLTPEQQAKRDREQLIKTNPILKRHYDKATGLTIGGGVMAGVGIVLAAVGGLSIMSIAGCQNVGLSANCERNLLITGLVTGIPGLGLMAGGGAMLGIGLKRRSALKDPNKPLPEGIQAPPPTATEEPTDAAEPAAPEAEPAPGPAAEPEQPTAFVTPLFLRDGGGAALTIRF